MCRFPANKLYPPRSVGESYDERQCDVETSDVALIEAAYELPIRPRRTVTGLSAITWERTRKPLLLVGSMVIRKSGAFTI